MIQILDSEKQLSLEDLNILEDKINMILPENYKNFLLKFKGGY